MDIPTRDSAGTPRCRRVGHSIIKAGGDLEELADRLEGAAWDMVELDVLARGSELLVAHSPVDLDHPRPLRFADALSELRRLLPAEVELNVDVKGPGYETAVLDTLRSLGLVQRTLVSTMEPSSLHVLRAAAPELRLGMSVPRARRDYLSHPLTRPAAHLMLAYLRRVLPRRAARAVRSGLCDAIMAHWGVVTPALVRAVRQAGGELYVWTVDDAERLRTLHALGVRAVITNDRDLFARAGLPAT
ncbi:MAG TPA: glycerophosphodiester phosphodiesterase [Solirubrobacteraceae bacterium]|jgi:glycerophosphoryl diester phosphodiesterase